MSATDLEDWQAFLARFGLTLRRADWADEVDYGDGCGYPDLAGAEAWQLEDADRRVDRTTVRGGCYGSVHAYFKGPNFLGLNINGG